jgi:hypothetical protein
LAGLTGAVGAGNLNSSGIPAPGIPAPNHPFRKSSLHGFVDQEEAQEDVKAQVPKAPQGQPPQEEVIQRA